MGVERIFSRGGTGGFFQKLSREGLKVVKFVFSDSKLRKQSFLLKFSKSRRLVSPVPTPMPAFVLKSTYSL